MTAEFDMVVAYATGGGVRHGRYFILSSNFILIIVILFIVYIIILCVGFLSVTVLWTAKVIVGSHLVGTSRSEQHSAQDEELIR
jgi:hypothetical protein